MTDAVDDAVGDADRAAARAGVVVEAVADHERCRRVAALFGEVWGHVPPSTPTPPELLVAVAHAGGYVTAAWRGDDLVGASAAFIGRRDGGWLLHSHITGVVASATGAGTALKLHQRAWALERGIPTITWTFDPLVRRNGYFNLTKLGGAVTGYHVDLYGTIEDRLNAGEPSDRCEVTWDLAAPIPAAADPDPAGAAVLLEPRDGRPHRPEVDPAAPRRRCWVPEDVVALRAADPTAARAWRLALRDAFRRALAEGFVVSAMTRDGWYLLDRRPAVPAPAP